MAGLMVLAFSGGSVEAVRLSSMTKDKLCIEPVTFFKQMDDEERVEEYYELDVAYIQDLKKEGFAIGRKCKYIVETEIETIGYPGTASSLIQLTSDVMVVSAAETEGILIYRKIEVVKGDIKLNILLKKMEAMTAANLADFFTDWKLVNRK